MTTFFDSPAVKWLSVLGLGYVAILTALLLTGWRRSVAIEACVEAHYPQRIVWEHGRCYPLREGPC